MSEENKNQNLKPEEKKDSKPYSLLMDHVHEDSRKKKKITLPKNIWLGLVFVLLIIIINLVNIYPLFKPGAPPLDSEMNEVISGVNLISKNMSADWVSNWFLGFPWYLYNNPLLPHLIYLIQSLFSFLGAAYIIRAMAAIFYILIPVGLYFFVRYLAKKEFTAVMAAVIFSAPPYFLFWIPQVRDVFGQTGFIPWLVHLMNTEPMAINLIFALFLLPLACLYYLKLIRNFRLKYLGLALIFVGLIALSSVVTFYASLILLAIITVSELILGQPGKKIKKGLGFFLALFGIISFWFNLSLVSNLYVNSDSGQVIRDLVSLLPLGFVVLPIIATYFFPFLPSAHSRQYT